MEIVSSVAALSLFLMGGLALHAAALLQAAPARTTLFLLAGFGLTDGLGLTLSLLPSSWFSAAGLLAQAAAYVLLIGFGLRLWRHGRAAAPPSGRAARRWPLSAAVAGALLATGAALVLSGGNPLSALAALPALGGLLAGAALLAAGLGRIERELPPAGFVAFGAGLVLHGLSAPLRAAPRFDTPAAAVPDLALLFAALSGSWLLWRYGTAIRTGLWRTLTRGGLSARAYGELLDSLDIGLLRVDTQGRVRTATPQAQRLLGGHDAAGRRLADFLPEAGGAAQSHFARTALEWRQHRLAGAGANDDAVLIALRPETASAAQMGAALVAAMPQPALFTDVHGCIRAASAPYLRHTGVARETLLGSVPELLHNGTGEPQGWGDLLRSAAAAGHWAGEVWHRDRSGTPARQWLDLTAVDEAGGERQGWLAVLSEISARGEVHERLRYLAYYDGLTGLPNRELFSDHLHLALGQARRESQLVGLMFLDLDRFKNINDTLGHNVGDQVLEAIAGRLRHCVREGDTISRLGGDEFTVILPALGTAADAATVAEKILRVFAEPLRLADQEFHITASVGISLAPHDGDDMESLIKNADTAMYRAKELGRNNFQFYTADMSARFHHWVALENDLRQALNSGRGLSVAYQPQLDIRSGKVVGVEALVRWHHPRLGNLAPGAFIPVAEESGLIGQLGEWVLRTACRDGRRWVDAGHRGFRVAVNLSAHQLGHRDLQAQIHGILAETGLDPRYLELELTETVLMSDVEQTHAMLHSLNRMGIELAIDDFGTGYSSLGYLRQFTIDKLKIDQSFVRDVPDDPNDATIATSIIAMAHKLKLKVIAEGVEKQTQLDFLRRYDCDQIQGFLCGAPGSAEEILHHLEQPATMH